MSLESSAQGPQTVRVRRRGPAVLIAGVALAAVAIFGGLPDAPPAHAASLTQVSSFGSNPGALSMYVYRPDSAGSSAPAVVLLHGCAQDAATYFANSGWRTLADRSGVVLVLPQTSSANNASKCFNWFETGDTSRGQGEAASVMSMVDKSVAGYGVNSSRVFVSGLSAGGGMTAALLATYPDRFAGGSINAGLPFRCATSMVNAFTCMNPGVDKTPRAWGDLARNAFSYNGTRPKVAIWQGLSDTTVAPSNATELRDQFTDLAGVGQAPSATGTLASGVTYEDYAGAVRVTRIAGMGHGTPVDPGTGADQCGTAGAYFLDSVCGAVHDARFFGIEQSAPPTTTTSSPPTTAPTSSTTAPPTTTAPVCVTASNYAHVQAGRAYQSGGYAYAVGSNTRLGLYNVFYTSTLKQTSPGYWQTC